MHPHVVSKPYDWLNSAIMKNVSFIFPTQWKSIKSKTTMVPDLPVNFSLYGGGFGTTWDDINNYIMIINYTF